MGTHVSFKYIKTYRWACFSEDQKYRYRLSRTWDIGPHVIFAMLNPSTADASVDDPTIRKCMSFAVRWGYGGISVLNLFALRATNPKELLKVSHDEAVGPDNYQHWESAIIEARRHFEPSVVVAWGAVHKKLRFQAETALGWLEEFNVQVQCLGKTKDCMPKHPLYLPYETTFREDL